MSVNQNSFEAGLDFFVKMKKSANFIGKNSLEKILSGMEPGSKNQLVLITIDSDNVDPEDNETIWMDNKVIGHTPWRSGKRARLTCVQLRVRASLRANVLSLENLNVIIRAIN